MGEISFKVGDHRPCPRVNPGWLGWATILNSHHKVKATLTPATFDRTLNNPEFIVCSVVTVAWLLSQVGRLTGEIRQLDREASCRSAWLGDPRGVISPATTTIFNKPGSRGQSTQDEKRSTPAAKSAKKNSKVQPPQEKVQTKRQRARSGAEPPPMRTTAPGHRGVPPGRAKQKQKAVSNVHTAPAEYARPANAKHQHTWIDVPGEDLAMEPVPPPSVASYAGSEWHYALQMLDPCKTTERFGNKTAVVPDGLGAGQTSLPSTFRAVYDIITPVSGTVVQPVSIVVSPALKSNVVTNGATVHAASTGFRTHKAFSPNGSIGSEPIREKPFSQHPSFYMNGERNASATLPLLLEPVDGGSVLYYRSVPQQAGGPGYYYPLANPAAQPPLSTIGFEMGATATYVANTPWKISVYGYTTTVPNFSGGVELGSITGTSPTSNFPVAGSVWNTLKCITIQAYTTDVYRPTSLLTFDLHVIGLQGQHSQEGSAFMTVDNPHISSIARNASSYRVVSMKSSLVCTATEVNNGGKVAFSRVNLAQPLPHNVGQALNYDALVNTVKSRSCALSLTSLPNSAATISWGPRDMVAYDAPFSVGTVPTSINNVLVYAIQPQEGLTANPTYQLTVEMSVEPYVSDLALGPSLNSVSSDAMRLFRIINDYAPWSTVGDPVRPVDNRFWDWVGKPIEFVLASKDIWLPLLFGL